MSATPVLALVIPVLAATALMAGGRLVSRRGRELFTLAACAATTAICVKLLVDAAGGADVYWFGGFRPMDGNALGIAFVIDPAAALLALMAAFSTTAAVLYAWHYFDDVHGLFHTLVLVLLTGMIGVALTADLFNLFVFLELTGLAAFALTATKIEQPSLTGSLSFAVVNTVGALFVLVGVGLLYGVTRALNFAEVGRALAALGPEAGLLPAVALAMIATGLLTKAAIAPFHFWLPEAYAVAPAPVAALFASLLLELGLYALMRLWVTVFAAALPPAPLQTVLMVLAAVSVLIGALAALREHQLKRMLAFITVSHAGLLLGGLALLEARAMGGAGIYLVSDGAARSALFLAVGVVLHRLGDVDEQALIGQGRGMWGTAAAFTLAGLVLAAAPWTGAGLGKVLMEEAAHHQGHLWWIGVMTVGSGLTAAAVLRAVARIFLGWGTPPERGPDTEPAPSPETAGSRRRTPLTMRLAVIAMLTVAVVPGFLPGLHHAAQAAGQWFLATDEYARLVMDGAATAPALGMPASTGLGYTATGLWLGAAGVALGGAVAGALLGWGRIPAGIRRPAGRLMAAVVRPLDAVHTSHVGDHLAWMVAGAAAVVLALTLLRPG